jgi:hypothetical protein
MDLAADVVSPCLQFGYWYVVIEHDLSPFFELFVSLFLDHIIALNPPSCHPSQGVIGGLFMKYYIGGEKYSPTPFNYTPPSIISESPPPPNS